MRKTGAQRRQECTQGHTASLPRQGLEPGLSLLGPEKPGEEEGLKGPFMVSTLKIQRPSHIHKNGEGAACWTQVGAKITKTPLGTYTPIGLYLFILSI